MMILPVEKQFDWSNPPVVLLVLLFLNVFAHVFYQSSDDATIEVALTAYLEQGFYAVEREKYDDYLQQEQDAEAVREVEALRETSGDFAVAYQMLRDEKFESYLGWNWDWELKPQLGNDWRERRRMLTDVLGRVSTVRFGLVPSELSPLTLLTYQFLHGDFMHLLGNMLFLMLCGFAVEAAIGHLRFLAFYLATGVAGGLGHALLNLDSAVPLIGASGAVSGVMAMYLALFRLRRIEFFYWLFVFVGYLRLPALAVLPLYVGKELWFMLAQPDSNVAFMAHVGGFVAGATLIGAMLLLRPTDIDEEYIETDQSVDPEKAALAEIYDAIEEYRFEAARRKVVAMREAWGDSFALRRLEQQLYAADRADGFEAATDALVSYRDASPDEIREQVRALNGEPEVLDRLPDDELMRLGARLGRIEAVPAVERVFATLMARGVEDDRIGVMARRLANAFRDLKNVERTRHYTTIADRYV